MAQKLSLSGGAGVKARSPLGILLLAIATLGFYYFVWYYKINRELRDFGASRNDPALEVEPAGALAAVTGGALLIVPPFISMWRTFKRIRHAEEIAGIEERVNHVIGFVLFLIAFFFVPVEMPYAQAHLNHVWRAVAREEKMRALGLRGQAAT